MAKLFTLSFLLLLLPTTGQTVVELVRNSPEFSSLTAALDTTGLSTDLSSEGPYTFFAPTDDAFAAASMNPTVSRWLAQPEVWTSQVIDLLTHHVLEKEAYSLDLNAEVVGTELYTLQDAPLVITATNPLQIENINVFEVDKIASNGLVHSIDEGLFLPPSAEQNLADLLRGMPFFSTFTRLLDETGLWDSVVTSEGPLTILAPTDEAFGMLTDEAKAMWETDPELMISDLLYHVVDGNYLDDDFKFEAPMTRRNEMIFPVEREDVVVPDILASNGVLHVVDRIQRVPATLPPTRAPLPTEIVGILRSETRGNFSMFLNSMEKTERLRDLVVNGPGNPFSVFAPINDAFVDLPAKFLDPVWETHLINVLTFHIVRGNVFTQNITTVGQRLPTLNFNALTVTSVNPPMVENRGIATPTIVADNGMIHVMNRMLLPPSATNYIMDLYALFPEFTGVLDRIANANLTTTLSLEGPMTVFTPVDGAFDNLLRQGTYDLPPETWREILLYHIVPGQLINFAELIEQHTPETLAPGEAAFLVDEEDEEVVVGNKTNATDVTPPLVVLELPTLQGSIMTVEVEPNRVGNAGLLFEDLLVLNGVVQVLDTVMIPPNVTLDFFLTDAAGEAPSAQETPPPQQDQASSAPQQDEPEQAVPVARWWDFGGR